MINVPDPIVLVTKIRKVATERNLTLNDIISLMKEKGEYPVAPATLSRMLSGDDEEANYNYLKTIIPVYNTLFDIDEIADDDDEKLSNMKAILDYKRECITELEKQIEQKDLEHKAEIEKYKAKLDAKKDEYVTKIEEERKRFQEIMDFRGNQIIQKDEIISKLLETNYRLSEHICNCREKGKCQ